jgi:hypothetical protein
LRPIEEQIREIRDRLAQIEIEMGREEGHKPVPRNLPDRSD